ncbi:hypothetical protein G4B88_006083, partial [Cannabis sativa]
MMRRQQDQQSGVLYELSSLVLNILRSPPSPIPFSDQLPEMPPTRRLSPTSSSSAASQISPAGFASLLLGISLALMLCGSVTFFIGFILMPWVLGLVMVFYVAGIVSSLSMLGRSIFCYAMGPSQPRKEIPAWKILMRSEVIESSSSSSRTVDNQSSNQILLNYALLLLMMRRAEM